MQSNNNNSIYIMNSKNTTPELSKITFLDLMIATTNGSESNLFKNNDVEPLNAVCCSDY